VYWGEFVLILGMIAASIPLAWRHLPQGRIDRRGALRVGVAVFWMRLIASMLEAAHPGTAMGETRILVLSSVGALAIAATAWLFYLALEPLVRRFWPHSLVTWTRALSGQWGDGAVGQHLLLGTVLGAFWSAAVRLSWLIPQWTDIGSRDALRAEGFLAAMTSMREAGAGVLESVLDGAYYGVVLLLLIVLLRALTGRPFVAGAIATLIFALPLIPQGSNPWVAAGLIGLAVVGVAAWTMIRFGLLPTAGGFAVMLLLNRAPLTLDFRAWYAEPAASVLIVVLAVGMAGLWASRRTPRNPAFA
jgi:hypothetical protein